MSRKPGSGIECGVRKRRQDVGVTKEGVNLSTK